MLVPAVRSIGLDKMAKKSKSKKTLSFVTVTDFGRTQEAQTQPSKEIKGHIQVRKKNFRVKIGLGKRGSYVYGPERCTVHEAYNDLKEVHLAPSRLEDICANWQSSLGSYMIPGAAHEAAAWRWLALSFAPCEIVPMLSCLRASEVTLLAKELKHEVFKFEDIPECDFDLDRKTEEFIFDGGHPKQRANRTVSFEEGLVALGLAEASVSDNQVDDKEVEDDPDYEDDEDVIMTSQSSASSASSGQFGHAYEGDSDMSSTESSSD